MKKQSQYFCGTNNLPQWPEKGSFELVKPSALPNSSSSTPLWEKMSKPTVKREHFICVVIIGKCLNDFCCSSCTKCDWYNCAHPDFHVESSNLPNTMCTSNKKGRYPSKVRLNLMSAQKLKPSNNDIDINCSRIWVKKEMKVRVETSIFVSLF